MATARELRQWVSTIRHWMLLIDDNRTSEHAGKLAAELEALAACEDVADRQLV